MDNETKRYIDAEIKDIKGSLLTASVLMAIFASLGFCAIGSRIEKLERKPANQAIASEKDIKAMLDVGVKTNVMWNERTEKKKSDKLKNEAYERALKGQVGLLPGVE